MNYDVIVIGAGQAAPGIAVEYTKKGQKAALIEADKLGGTCLNYGCRPTKTLRASAHMAHQARRMAEYGINVGDVTVDFAAVMARKDKIIGEMQTGYWDYMDTVENLDIIYGYGKFAGKDGDNFIVEVNGEQHTAPKVYINTGTRARIPEIDGIHDVPYLTNKDILYMDDLPEHLVIIGGGIIGMEFGQMFRRFGSEVTIIEVHDHIAYREDDDIAAHITQVFEDEGINVLTSAVPTQVSKNDDDITVTLEDGRTVTGSHLLVGAGRQPNSDQLNLQSIGVETNERGFIPTDGQFLTNVPNVWAVGDVNGRGAFTHTSYQDYEIVVDNINGGDRSADGRLIPYGIFIDPPFGRAGLDEEAARETGRNILMMTHEMKGNSRARLDSNTQGIVKLLVDADTEEIIGFVMFGVGADEIVQIFSNYMHTGASYKIMKEALPVHPTVAEFIPTWLGMLKPLD